MTRTGRPKVSDMERKEIKYSIRMDADTEKRLQMYCKEQGLTKGEAIRRAIIQMLDKKE